jgi:hypothetical protein
MWLLESADRSRVGVVVASQTLRNVWGYADGKQLIRKAATSALTFMTFS